MEHLLLMMMNNEKHHPWVPSGSFSRMNTLQSERRKPTVTELNHVNTPEVGGVLLGPNSLLFYCHRSSVTTTPPKSGDLCGYIISISPSLPSSITLPRVLLFIPEILLSQPPESWDYRVHHSLLKTFVSRYHLWSLRNYYYVYLEGRQHISQWMDRGPRTTWGNQLSGAILWLSGLGIGTFAFSFILLAHRFCS